VPESYDRLLSSLFQAAVTLRVPRPEAVRGASWLTAGDRSFLPVLASMWHASEHVAMRGSGTGQQPLRNEGFPQSNGFSLRVIQAFA